ncbi:MAG: DUF3846 domain-containing protein [Mycoplasmatota bacterium]
MQRNLKCLMINPGEVPYEITIPNTLKSKQKLVKGNIEYAYLEDREDVCFICNEEGKILDMEPNRFIGYDILCGPVALVGYNYEMGEDRSLTDDQIKYFKKRFGKDSIKETENYIVALTIKEKDISI